MDRIVRISGQLRMLNPIVAAFVVIGLVVSMVDATSPAWLLLTGQDELLDRTEELEVPAVFTVLLSWSYGAVMAAISLVRVGAVVAKFGAVLVALWNVQKLLGLYTQRRLFEPANGALLRNIGGLILIASLIPTMIRQGTEWGFRIQLEPVTLFAGLLVMLLGLVMLEAGHIRDELDDVV